MEEGHREVLGSHGEHKKRRGVREVLDSKYSAGSNGSSVMATMG